ncbi:MAG: DUF4038 domain-containing protein [Pseudomonadota bacterium]
MKHRTRFSQTLMWTALICSCALLDTQLLAAEPVPGQLVTDPDNPAWLTRHGGGTYFLAGPGDPEDFLYRGERNPDGTRNGDQEAIIQKLSATGANSIYFQAVRSHGGDGDNTHNPFLQNDPKKGLNPAVLDQWQSWFDRMDANDITLFFFVYDDSSRIWDTGDSVSDAESEFVKALVNRFKNYRNLIWVIAEEYAEAYSAARIEALARIVKETDSYERPVAVHKNSGLSFDEFSRSPYIDQFAIQYNVDNPRRLNSGINEAWLSSRGRYNLNLSEADAWGLGKGARDKAWASAMGGAYVMAYQMDIASTPLSDLEDLGRLRTFMEMTRFKDMSPDNTLASGDSEYVLAKPGESYIVYGSRRVSRLGLTRMELGHYTMLWFDPTTGQTSKRELTVESPGKSHWRKPESFGEEAAVYILRKSWAAE